MVMANLGGKFTERVLLGDVFHAKMIQKHCVLQ